MKFSTFFKQSLSLAIPYYLTIGVLLAALIAISGGIDGGIDLDLEISALEGLSLIAIIPLLLLLIATLLSPIAFGLYWLGGRLLKRSNQ